MKKSAFEDDMFLTEEIINEKIEEILSELDSGKTDKSCLVIKVDDKTQNNKVFVSLNTPSCNEGKTLVEYCAENQSASCNQMLVILNTDYSVKGYYNLNDSEIPA